MATFYLHNSEIKATVSASAAITSSTNTTATITVTATGSIPSGWYVYSTGVVATITINGSSTTKTVFGNATEYYYGKDGSKSVTYAVTVDKGTAAKSISWSVAFKNAVDGSVKDTKYTATGTVSVSAKPSYTISYNANGGSGAPSSQTKWYGTNLTLSSTKPTRTGYSFSKWNTTSGGTGTTYNAGATYSANANATLYAQWTADTYTVSYNANGGSGAPSSQTKTYGVTLKLSTTKPTRENYNFLGWATSASATTATYASGANYTANTKVTLYAVWELAYVKPRITNLSVSRYDTATSSISDSGTSVLVNFDYECDLEIDGNEIEWESETESGSVYDFGSFSGTSGTVKGVIDGTTFTTESTYTFKITVTDANDYSTEIVTLPGMKFAIDFKAGGNGAAFGKPAELDDVLDVAFQTRFLGGILYTVLEPETDLNDVTTPGFYVGENVSTYNYSNCPLTSGTFTLEVLSGGDYGQTLQRLTRCHKTEPIVYERWYYASAWADWYGGWITATITGPFGNYNDTSSHAPKYRKDGRIVEVRGIITPTEDIEYSTTHITIFTLPEGYRPDMPLYALCQGTGNCVWLLRINTDGTVGFARYRNGDANTTADAGVWLPFNVTYFAK